MSTNTVLSNLARQASGAIRIQYFSEFDFGVGVDVFNVYRRDVSVSTMRNSAIYSERFSDELDLIEFISEAFRHCVIGDLRAVRCSGRVLSAIKEAARTVIVAGTLTVDVDRSVAMKEVVDLDDAFQQVTVSALRFARLAYSGVVL